MKARQGTVRPSIRPRGVLAAAVAALLLAATPAAADWLVTRSGERIETKGEWQVKGQLVVFHLVSGELASLRLSGVDLEASRAATEEAAKPAPKAAAPKAEPVKPVLVLTDADVSHVRPGDTAEGGEGEEGSGEEAAGGEGGEAPRPERLVVASWEEIDDPRVEGVTITGQLRNSSEEVTAQTTLTVKLYDPDGELLASTDARLTATSLTPGQTANFRAAFPTIFTYETVRFETESLALASGDGEEGGDES